ncbi:TPA: glycosyltransferase family 61 protein, partial [Streptococcus suis]
ISDANIRFVDIYRAPVPILYGFGPFLMDLTLPLITFLDKNNFTYEKTPILDKKDYFNFYFRWLWTYKFFIFRINSIKEGNNEFEKEFTIIRKFYKLGKNV